MLPNSYEKNVTEASVVAELAARSKETRCLTLADKVAVLAVPDGTKVQSIKALLDEYLTAPERRKGTAMLADLDSFIAHTKRFSDADSAIFASPNVDKPSLISVLNYHRIGSGGAPRFGDHRGLYNFPLADEWKEWKAKNGEVMSQQDFAEFLEEHLVDIADPASAMESAKNFAQLTGLAFATPAKLLDLSRGLSVRVESRVANNTNLASGEGSLLFEQTHKDETGAPLKVPGAFLVAIPVFRTGAAYQMAVRLRYRVRDHRVTWSFDLYKHEAVFDHAFKEACTKAQTETGLPVFVGAAE